MLYILMSRFVAVISPRQQKSHEDVRERHLSGGFVAAGIWATDQCKYMTITNDDGRPMLHLTSVTMTTELTI